MSSPDATAFRYEAARADGVLVRGSIEAASGSHAVAILADRGLFPLSVAPRTSSRRRHVGSARAHALVFQCLASLTEAGVPLDRALASASALVPGPLRDSLERVAERVRQGTSLASALATEQAFPPVAIGLVRAAEQGVGLAAGLQQAAAQLERDAETRARVRAALTYPLLLACVGTASVGLMVLYVIPRFAALLGDLGQDLPAATRALMTATDMVRTTGPFLLIGSLVGAVLLVRFVTQHPALWHGWLLRVPVVGGLRASFGSARAARTLGVLVETGAPALHALRVAGEAVGDAAIATRLATARDRVAEGQSFSTALAASQALTPPVLQLVRVGESSGRLAPLLEKAADLELRSAERRLAALVSLIEPALIIAFASLVAFVAAALLQAVYAVRPGGM